ncbi:MAG: peptide chain release factor N(5)-glutamine methyltransferase [Bacteroidetes bacterium]|nr:peptide chain release factor N(5)-glutamine methyltransferase [Bacteroidota bacterium]
MPQNIQEVKELFMDSLFPLYDREEVKNFCFLTCEKFLNFSRIDLRQKSAMEIQVDLAKKFTTVVEELMQHKPIQYILGETEFYGLIFLVDENVLIPRQETEELVDWILNQNKSVDAKSPARKPSLIRILDIGTGSGCIPIALKKNMQSAQVFALDVSEKALHQAQTNARLNDVSIEFIRQDILNIDVSIDALATAFDVMISNPPYIRNSESRLMHKNVLEYEPHLALFVPDENPLLFYEAIATFAKKTLRLNGQIYFEINEALGGDVIKLLANKGFKQIELRKDLNGKDRMIKAINA